MIKFDTVVIGGGASGIVAAISAKRKGRSVLICEKMPSLGKKILASGNGRCNLLNEKLDESYYNEAGQRLVDAVFAKRGKEDIKNFFRELGLVLYADGDRVFPITNRSASVLRVLEIELKRLSIPVKLDFEISRISSRADGFTVGSKTNQTVECRALILAAGGKTYPALGSDGSGYGFAEQFGHRIIKPVPSAVPLVVKDRLCHLLQGQKIFAKVKSVITDNALTETSGDLLFTKYGLSGTAILDISEDISIAVNRLGKKDVYISIDMAPFLEKEALKAELERRARKGMSPGDLLAGLLPDKFGIAFSEVLHGKDIEATAAALKDKRFRVIGTRSWNEAEFTAGGVDTNEVKESTLESRLKKGLYFAGEILDVDGKRGGYNLAWAWASGFVAGLTE